VRDRDYLVEGSGEDAQVRIIDEGTGRVLADRRWRDGIHEALEAKEGIEVRGQSSTLASVTVPAYLKSYELVGGMTGTAKSAEDEFAHLYDLGVLCIPTHRPKIREDRGDLLFVTEVDKLAAMVRDLRAYQAAGRPVLVGAPTVEDAEQLSAALRAASIEHVVLSAREHEREAQVIAQAGRKGAVTVATNMAGRGVDILLGGDLAGLLRAEEELTGPLSEQRRNELAEQCARERAEIIAAGGLVVMATARHSSKRIDDQLRGRAGRQGEPGTTQFYLSCEDELLVHFTGGRLGALLTKVTSKQGEALSHKMVDSVVDDAQSRAEGAAKDQRNQLAKLDQVYAAQQDEVYRFRDQILEGSWQDNLASWCRLADQYLVLADNEWPFLDDPVLDAATGQPVGQASPHDDHDEHVHADIEEWDDDDQPGPVDDLAAATAAVIDGFLDRSAGVTDYHRDAAVRLVLCQTIDASWQNQLSNLDALRDGVYLKAGVGDPMAQFGLDAFSLFERMLTRMLAIGIGRISLAVVTDEA